MRRLRRRQVAERDHPQRDPGLGLVTTLVEFDKAFDRYPAHLLGENWSAGHLGMELGIGEARGERECRAADDKAKPGSPAGKDQSRRRHDQSCGGQQAGLLGKREISEDAAAEQNRDPKREAVGFGFQRAGNGRERECYTAQAALRLARPML